MSEVKLVRVAAAKDAPVNDEGAIWSTLRFQAGPWSWEVNAWVLQLSSDQERANPGPPLRPWPPQDSESNPTSHASTDPPASTPTPSQGGENGDPPSSR